MSLRRSRAGNDSTGRGCDACAAENSARAEEIPVQPGPLTLFYPAWIPGEHAPDGPIIEVAGMKFTANGKRVAWRRDLVDMFSIHLDIPAGANLCTSLLIFCSPHLLRDFPRAHPPRRRSTC